MSKAILVIDMPSSCADCILGDDDSSGLYCVPKEEYFDGEDTTESRASFCPLREVPQKDTKQYADSYKYGKGRQRGRNECIDEILGGAEHG